MTPFICFITIAIALNNKKKKAFVESVSLTDGSARYRQLEVWELEAY